MPSMSTSPYQPNDYTALKLRQPYRLPIQEIAQAAMALDSFWKAGAQRVKSAYDSALNLNLTSDENKEVKKKFIDDAQKQLTKLSSMDLADPSVQRQGLGIFKPLFDDKDIIMDDYLTNLKQNIFSEADKFKRDPKTKGAGFHMDNLAYALQGFQGFNSKTPRGAIGDIFEGAKDSQYIPFYDDSKERLAILKSCTADKMGNTSPNGAYMHSTSDNSKTAEKIWGCLDSGLSLESRQQTRISGTVRYGHDYQAVKNDYVEAATGQLKHYTDEKAVSIARLEALKKTPDSQEKTDQLAYLQEIITSYDDGISHVNELLNGSTASGTLGYNQWDEKFIKDHYEDLASTAFFRKSNLAFASAFSNVDRNEADKANPIWITERTQYGQDTRLQFTQANENARQQAGFQHDTEMENLKALHKSLSGDENGSGKDPLAALKNCANTPGCDLLKAGTFELKAITEDPTTSQKLQAQITDLEGSKAKTIKDLANDKKIGELIKDYPALKDVSKYGTEEFNDQYNKMWKVLNTYADNTPKDANGNLTDVTALKIVKATNDLLQIDNEKDMLKGVYDDAYNEVIKNNPKLAIDDIQKIDQIKADAASKFQPIKTASGQTIDGKRFLNILDGADPQFSVKDSGIIKGLPKIIDNSTGKQVNISPNSLQLKSSLANYYNNFILHKSDFHKEVDKVIGGNTLVQHMGLAMGNIFTKGSLGMQNMEALFGQELGIIDDNQPGPGKVVFNSSAVDPITGETIIEASKIGTGGDQDKLTYQEMRDAINKHSGAGNAIYGQEVPGNNHQIKIKLPAAVGLIQAPVYGDKIRKQLDYYETKVGSLPYEGVIIKVGRAKDGTLFSVRLSREIGGNGPSYTLIANGADGAEVELPFRNAGGLSDKENIISTLNNRLLGLLEK